MEGEGVIVEGEGVIVEGEAVGSTTRNPAFAMGLAALISLVGVRIVQIGTRRLDARV